MSAASLGPATAPAAVTSSALATSSAKPKPVAPDPICCDDLDALPLADRQQLDVAAHFTWVRVRDRVLGRHLEKKMVVDRVPTKKSFTFARTTRRSMFMELHRFLWAMKQQQVDLAVGLRSLYSPEHFTHYVYATPLKRGGGPMGKQGPDARRQWTFALFERCVQAGVYLLGEGDTVDAQRISHNQRVQELKAAYDGYIGETNVRVDPEGEDEVPTLSKRIARQVLATQSEYVADKKRLYAEGRLSREKMEWVLEENALILCAYFAMTRRETLSTLNGRCIRPEIRPDPRTGQPREFNVRQKGTMVFAGVHTKVVNGAGGKTARTGDLILPRSAVNALREYVEFRGHTLEDLGPTVELSAERGDRWGNGTLIEGTVLVQPVFYARDGRVGRPLSYTALYTILKDALLRLGVPRTNPHTFRYLGAIYWHRIREASLPLVCRLGLWHDEDAKTLLKVYARLEDEDLDEELDELDGARDTDAATTVSERGHALRLLAHQLADYDEVTATGAQRDRLEGSLQRALSTLRTPAGGTADEERVAVALSDLLRIDEALQPLGGLRAIVATLYLARDQVDAAKEAAEARRTRRRHAGQIDRQIALARQVA